MAVGKLIKIRFSIMLKRVLYLKHLEFKKHMFMLCTPKEEYAIYNTQEYTKQQNCCLFSFERKTD